MKKKHNIILQIDSLAMLQFCGVMTFMEASDDFLLSDSIYTSYELVVLTTGH